MTKTQIFLQNFCHGQICCPKTLESRKKPAENKQTAKAVCYLSRYSYSTVYGWTIDAGQSVAQISTKIPNPFIAGMVYWLFLILVVGICVAGTGILAILIEIKVIELYKKNCWDVITLLMILTSTAVIIYFGEAIKKALSVNLLLLFVLSQGVYLGIRCYLKNRLGTKQYW